MSTVPTSSADPKRPRSKFPQSFWVANTMEIFERLAWYGFFAVSTLYITGSRSEGALGFTSEQRGVLQGIVPFILYLLPVVFGALADRFGYKKTFTIAYATLVPAYYLLGQFTAFGTFFMAFLFVAVGAAIFKPVVVGTVARTTDETNSSMGFGIFYMMVNIGGFVGPIVAGFVRVRYGWNWVFVASAFWIACNFIWLFLFYKEPTTEAGRKRTLKQVFSGIVEVLGNGRFFILVFGILIMFMFGGRSFTWTLMGLTAAGWILLNLLIDIPLRAKERRGEKLAGLSQPMKVGNWKFALYLLILSGFWTSFNQIFLTMPEYIRDYVETGDMVRTARSWFGDDFSRGLAAVNEELLAERLGELVSEEANLLDARAAAVASGAWAAVLDTIRGNEPSGTVIPASVKLTPEQAHDLRWELFDFKVRVPEDELITTIGSLPLSVYTPVDSARVSPALLAKVDSLVKARNLNEQQRSYLLGGIGVPEAAATRQLAAGYAERHRQVNPEYIINVDAGAIVVFQVLVSYMIGFFPPLSAMVVGIIVAAVGIGMGAWIFSGWLITLAITIFAFGEMMASPKSQEYVGRIAPTEKMAMYMGFYFWTVALGNIFGGRLSGELYGSLARDAGRPDIMWIIFGVLGLITALILVLYDKLVLRKGEMR